MTETKRLYRSNNAMIAGVCAGVAEYFAMDVTLLRVLAVLLLVIGVGSPIIVYLILWAVVPKAPDDYSAYVDVAPLDTPQPAEKRTAVDGRPTGAPEPPAEATAAYVKADESTYVPPVPPTVKTNEPVSGATGEPVKNGYAPPGPKKETPGAAYSATPGAAYSATPGAAYSATYGAAYDAKPPKEKVQAWYIGPAVVFGLVLICLGLSTLVSRFIPDFSLWAYWPLIIVAFGVLEACTPGKKGWSISRVFSGLSTVTIGLVLFACTTRFFGWGVWYTILTLWPIFLVAFGVSIIASGLRSTVLEALASLIFIFAILLGCHNYYYSTDYLAAPVGFYIDENGAHADFTLDGNQANKGTTDASSTSMEADIGDYEAATMTFQGGVSVSSFYSVDTDIVSITGSEGLLDTTALTVIPVDDVAQIDISTGFANDGAALGSIAVGIPSDKVWKSVSVSSGASDLDLDFSKLMVERVTVEAGVSDVALHLGAPVGATSSVLVSAGVSNVEIDVPRGAPVILYVEGGLNDMTVEGLTWDSVSKSWRSPGYEAALSEGEPCWDISIEGGLGSFDISVSE
ncbi:MAG: PspC domain-containing protein [Actinobacteria bacterium]|nr:PspC domain-containing protein [Actinomycetota bacterium]